MHASSDGLKLILGLSKFETTVACGRHHLGVPILVPAIAAGFLAVV